MAFASVGSAGSGSSKTANQSSTALTTSATIEAGNLAVLMIAVDNNASTDGDEGAVSSVTDSAGGNTWSKALEFCFADTASQAGSTCSVWYCVLATQLSSGGTVTANYTNNTSRDAMGWQIWEFTKGASTTVAVEATNTQASDGTDPASLDAITANIECLRIRAVSVEGASDGQQSNITTNTTSWTNIPRAGTTGGSATSNQTISGEFHISTGTGDASDPTYQIAGGDRASCYVAFKEVAAGTNLSPGQGNLALSTTAPSRVIDVRRDPGQANLALSTTAPTVLIDTPRIPSTADLTLSTTAPTVTWTDNHFRDPVSGDLALSTTAPTVEVTAHRDLSPETAQLALSTTAPSVVIGFDLRPAAADLALSTTAPTVTVDFRFTPATADLALTTDAPSVVVDYRREPAGADLALSTTVPTVTWTDHHFRNPAAGNLALSTTAPTLAVTENRDLAPAAAQLALSTTAPTVEVTTSGELSPAAGQLALSTTAPTLSVSEHRDLSPGAAQLALSTTAPTVVVTSTEEVVAVPGGGTPDRKRRKTQKAAGLVKAKPKRKKKRKDEDKAEPETPDVIEAPEPVLDVLPPVPALEVPILPPADVGELRAPEKSPLPPVQEVAVAPEPEKDPLPPPRPQIALPPEGVGEFKPRERDPLPPAPPPTPLPPAEIMARARDEQDLADIVRQLPAVMRQIADRDRRDLEDIVRAVKAPKLRVIRGADGKVAGFEVDRNGETDTVTGIRDKRGEFVAIRSERQESRRREVIQAARDARDLQDIARVAQAQIARRPIAQFRLARGPDGAISGAAVQRGGRVEHLQVARDHRRQIYAIQRLHSRNAA